MGSSYSDFIHFLYGPDTYLVGVRYDEKGKCWWADCVIFGKTTKNEYLCKCKD